MDLDKLVNLDVLTDIFSFFTPKDVNYGRPVCKWWNDLLSKDVLIKKQVVLNVPRLPFFFGESSGDFLSLAGVPRNQVIIHFSFMIPTGFDVSDITYYTSNFYEQKKKEEESDDENFDWLQEKEIIKASMLKLI
jgi:hypothetical protein